MVVNKFLIFACLVVVYAVVLTSSSPASEREITNEKIRGKARSLFANFRHKARTLYSLKHAEWKEADISSAEMEENLEIAKIYQHIEKEAEYEIKQRIVDALAGEETPEDPDLPRLSERIASLFIEALFASTYEEQSRKEDGMMEILKDVLEKRHTDH